VAWQPHVTIPTVHYKTFRCALLFALCALVFFFAWHAKTAVYNTGCPTKTTPCTAAKLWLNSEKMGARSVDLTSSPMLWMAVLCFYSVYMRRERLNRTAYLTPPPSNSTLCDLHLFLRPPPVQA
jgi:hypothetical protein